MYHCDDTPSALRIRQLLRTISLLSRWSTSGSERGIAHFFTATRNTIKGVGGKNKEQMNNMLWSTQSEREELCNIAFPMCICRLTLEWISSETSTKLLGMPTHPERSSLTAHANWSLLLSGVDCHSRHPSPNWLLRVPFPSPLAFPYLLPVTSRSLAQAFVWFRAKTDKGIVCLADHLHSVTPLVFF